LTFAAHLARSLRRASVIALLFFFFFFFSIGRLAPRVFLAL
jgi:hypothetical protein